MSWISSDSGSSSNDDLHSAIDTHLLSKPGACIFAGNLNSSKSDTELHNSVQNHFATWGPIASVKIQRDSKGRPTSFIQYIHIADAKKALAESFHSIKLDGRLIRVEPAKVNRTLFISGFKPSLKYHELIKKLEIHGPVEDLVLLHRNRTTNSSATSATSCTDNTKHGAAFVKFFSREDAIKAFLFFRQARRHSSWSVEWSFKIQHDPYSSISSTMDQDQSGHYDIPVNYNYPPHGSLPNNQFTESNSSDLSACPSYSSHMPLQGSGSMTTSPDINLPVAVPGSKRYKTLKQLSSLQKEARVALSSSSLSSSSLSSPFSSIDKTSIFIGRINEKKVTEDNLYQWASEFGEIRFLYLVNKFPDGEESRPAYAFVGYLDTFSAELAVENGVIHYFSSLFFFSLTKRKY